MELCLHVRVRNELTEKIDQQKQSKRTDQVTQKVEEDRSSQQKRLKKTDQVEQNSRRR